MLSLLSEGLGSEEVASRRDRITLRDACYIARYNRVFEAPREALLAATGQAGVEMTRSRERGFCYGAGGAVYWHSVPCHEQPAAQRIHEALEAGANTIAVECPFCLKALEEAAAFQCPHLDVLDIPEIVAASIATGEQ